MGMSFGQYSAGFAAAVISLGSLWWAAAIVRGRLLPGWTGALARVVEAVLALSALTCALQILGLIGILSGPSIV